jgi:HEAT repeat protein
MLRPLVLVCLMSALVAEDRPEPQGVDMVPLIKQGVELLKPKPPEDKPWAYDLADLTDHDPSVHGRAIRNLISHGREVLPEVTIIAGDSDWRIRARVAQVAAGIGGSDGAPLLLKLSHDPDLRVRESATLGLGQCRGEGVYERLAELLITRETTLREKAAVSLGALGDLRAIGPLALQRTVSDDLVRREMARSLNLLVQNPAGVAAALVELDRLDGDARDAVIEAVAPIGDRRLVPPLVRIAEDPQRRADGTRTAASAWTQISAVRALGICGDRRAWQTLAALAAQHPQPEVKAAAAVSLKALTGYGANPGKAWEVWWTAQAGRAQAQAGFDALVAAWHDPAAVPDPTALADLTAEQRDELLDACLGRPEGRLAPWWPSLAWRVIGADDPARWATLLADRAIAVPSGGAAVERLQLIALIERLGGPAARAAIERIADDLTARVEPEAERAAKTSSIPPDHRAEWKAIELARTTLPAP